MGLKDELEEIVSSIIGYNPPPEIDEWIAEESSNLYDGVVKVFFMARVLANIQLSLILYAICLASGKARKSKNPDDVRIRVILSSRKKTLDKVIEEISKIQGSLEEMTDDQRVLYKKEHLSDLEYMLDYYLSILRRTEVEYCRNFKELSRKRFGEDRFWHWFRFTELGKKI